MEWRTRSNGVIVFAENHELHEDFSDNAPLITMIFSSS